MKTTIKEFINEALVKFDNLTPELMSKQFPVSEKDIIKTAKSLISQRKGASVSDIYISSNTKKYDTFAMLQKTLTISSVSPGGTYHSKKGVNLQFHFRGYWTNSERGNKVEFSINASKTTPGGMATYESAPVTSLFDIKQYMSSILRDNSPNSVTDDLY